MLRALKWIAIAVAAGFFGKLLVGPLSVDLFRIIDRQLSYKFDRPIASVFEFQSAVYLRGVMVQDHCSALGFDLDERQFFTAAERLGFARSQVLENLDLHRIQASVEKMLPRDTLTGNVTCKHMFELLRTAVPESIENSRVPKPEANGVLPTVEVSFRTRAAKNIYLASTALPHCILIVPKKEHFAAYARENGIELSEVAQIGGSAPYANERKYADSIVRAHIQIAGEEALCKAILEDFGPDGKLVPGLLEENMFGDLIPTERKVPF